MAAWTYCLQDGKAAQKIFPPRPRIPCWKGLGADSEEKHEPARDIDTVSVDSLKTLDPNRPIREADSAVWDTGNTPHSDNPALRNASSHRMRSSGCLNGKRSLIL